MPPLKALTLGCAQELLWLHGCPSGNIWQSQQHTGMSPPASRAHWREERTELTKIISQRDNSQTTDRIPCVFLDTNFFWDGKRKDDDETHDEESKSLVSVPVIRHFSLTWPRHHHIHRNAHWRNKSRIRLNIWKHYNWRTHILGGSLD